MLKMIPHTLIGRAEKRIGVLFDYVHAITDTDSGLLTHYNRLFGFLDLNRCTPQEAWHIARIVEPALKLRSIWRGKQA